MTFLQEEEVFPNFSVSDAPVKEVNETVITSDAPGKEEVNDASEILGTMQNGKRKLPDKEAEKKVFHLKFSSFSLSRFLNLIILSTFLLVLIGIILKLNMLPNISFRIVITIQEANKPPDSWFELKVNTHVYVTGLPEDVTIDEVSHGHFVYLV